MERARLGRCFILSAGGTPALHSRSRPAPFPATVPAMNGDTTKQLKALSEIDGALARILAERKRVEKELAAVEKEIATLRAQCSNGEKIVADRRSRVQKEDRSVKEENEKLVTRRKSLHTLGAYKLQQAAEREIDHASRQLEAREEVLLKMFDEVERMEGQLKELREGFAAKEAQKAKIIDDARAASAELDRREHDAREERESMVGLVESGALSLYERIHEKFPGDTVVSVEAGNCSACFMQVPPQVLVQLTEGKTPGRCRGCGRILYLTESSSPKAEGE